MAGTVGPGPAALRLFLALWPDAATVRRIAAHADGWTLPGRRMPPQDWHVTLHYIGKVAAERIPAVADALALQCPPFELVLDQPRLWPRGLAVVEASRVPEPLGELHAALAAALRQLELPVEERRFRPHVTLARNAGEAEPPARPLPIAWPVRGYRLVVSTGQPQARYLALRAYDAA